MNSLDDDNNRWWERFHNYKTYHNNQHDWFMVWADIKLSGLKKSILYERDKNRTNRDQS